MRLKPEGSQSHFVPTTPASSWQFIFNPCYRASLPSYLCSHRPSTASTSTLSKAMSSSTRHLAASLRASRTRLASTVQKRDIGVRRFAMTARACQNGYDKHRVQVCCLRSCVSALRAHVMEWCIGQGTFRRDNGQDHEDALRQGKHFRCAQRSPKEHPYNIPLILTIARSRQGTADETPQDPLGIFHGESPPQAAIPSLV